MLRLVDQEIININSKLLLILDNRTNKYLPASICQITKSNQKNMNHKTWKHREEASIKNMLKQQKKKK